MNSLKDKSIEELAKLAKDGDRLALDELLRRPELENVIRGTIHNADYANILKNEQDKEDIVQNVHGIINQEIATWEGRSLFTTWVYRIAYNECTTTIAKGTRWERILKTLENDYNNIGSRTVEGVQVPSPPPLTKTEEEITKKMKIELLKKIIHKYLNEREVRVVYKHIIEGKPMEEIMKQLGVGRSMCAKLYKAGIIKILKRYLKYYFSLKKQE